MTSSYVITSLLMLIMMMSSSGGVHAFVPASPQWSSFSTRVITTTTTTTPALSEIRDNGDHYLYYLPMAFQRQRKSVAAVQTMGLFGLGAPEIGVILVAAAFLLGPQKLAELGKDAGKIAGELKEVPKEFQKGLEEGERQAKAIKAESGKVLEAETTTAASEESKTA